MYLNAASEYLLNIINEATQFCITQTMIQETKSTHSWFTDKMEDLVEAKQAAKVIPNEREAAEAFSPGILRQFIENTRESAQNLR